MQSYVVRVYRRNPDNKDEVAGIIEKVGTPYQNSFLNLSDLQESLKHLIASDDAEDNWTDAAAVEELLCLANSQE